MRKGAQKFGWARSPVAYRSKVKLHGTNAGITVKYNGEVFAQSRSRIIAVGDDNMAFAAWVDKTKDFWTKFAPVDSQITVFGEWCGKGIMKGVAISQIPEKVYSIFAIQYGDSDYGASTVAIEPAVISNALDKAGTRPENVYVLPWYSEAVEVDFNDDEKLQKTVDLLNEMVDKVEKEDPWVKEVFEVSGTGEGLVFYPISPVAGNLVREDFSQFVFKAKGEKHQVIKSKKAVEIDPIVAASVDDFVEKVVTEARLEQGAREINRGELEFDIKLIGPFIGWIGKDVKKETEAELKASDLEWKQVTKALSAAARKWYLEKIEEI